MKLEGIFGVYKPKGPTSHDIVYKVRRLTGVKKVGHAGTLDPLASGVLVIAVGREATKKLSQVVQKEKEYIADIRLGMESTTDDEEGEKTIWKVSKNPTLEQVEKVIAKFEGKIKQRPPIFSAIKIKGKRAYKLARALQNVVLKPRIVEVKEIAIMKYKWPNLKIRVVTGPGVYIRSIARDIGEKLKTGGFIAELERIRVGEFGIKDAINL